MRFGSLFAGIGGMDLGLERAGMTCAWQVEIDPFCKRVLAKHWPEVKRHDDVRTFPPSDADRWSVDLIAGGFPCQDVSLAGKGVGIDGERSGLWREYARIIRIIRPRYVIVENSPGLLSRGFGRVLGDLAALGFNAEWSTVSACAMGAPHTRERVFVVAYTHSVRLEWRWDQESRETQDRGTARQSEGRLGGHDWSLASRPPLLPLAHELPGRVDGLRTFGNAVVPQVAEWIGRRILDAVA
jgi:DNA (cytosine-5)-methyltransferase 1